MATGESARGDDDVTVDCRYGQCGCEGMVERGHVLVRRCEVSVVRKSQKRSWKEGQFK